MNTDIPSVEEELNRKAVDELLRLSTMHEDGVITAAEYKIGIDVLFNTVSGLVDRDFFEMITAAGEEVNVQDSSFFRMIDLCNGDNVVRINWSNENEAILIETIVAKSRRDKVIKMDSGATPSDTLAKVKGIEKKFTDAGYDVQ